MLQFLQQNAEWMSTVVIAVFTIVLCRINYEQNEQNLRLKRLELAQQLDKQFVHFPYDRDRCKILLDWLMSNRSLFLFLLNKKDAKKFWQLGDFIFELQSRSKGKYLQENDDVFFQYVGELQQALGNAKYDIRSYANKKQKAKKLEKKED